MDPAKNTPLVGKEERRSHLPTHQIFEVLSAVFFFSVGVSHQQIMGGSWSTTCSQETEKSRNKTSRSREREQRDKERGFQPRSNRASLGSSMVMVKLEEMGNSDDLGAWFIFLLVLRQTTVLLIFQNYNKAIGRDSYLTQPEVHGISLVGFCWHACAETWDRCQPLGWFRGPPFGVQVASARGSFGHSQGRVANARKVLQPKNTEAEVD